LVSRLLDQKTENFFETHKVEKILKKCYYFSVNLQAYIMFQVGLGKGQAGLQGPTAWPV